jgi:hypothetical protein
LMHENAVHSEGHSQGHVGTARQFFLRSGSAPRVRTKELLAGSKRGVS